MHRNFNRDDIKRDQFTKIDYSFNSERLHIPTAVTPLSEASRAQRTDLLMVGILLHPSAFKPLSHPRADCDTFKPLDTTDVHLG